jgi:hypothetical protein
MGFCDGVRFSPDGKQVAVWVRDPARVLLWEVGGGRPARVIPVPLTYGDTFGTRSGYRGPNIEFSPDASLIVLRGHWVFDARIGHLIAAVDGTLDLSGRHRLVSNEQFLVRESTGEFGSCRVKVLALPPRPTAAALAGPARLKPHDAVSVAFDGVTVRFGDQAAAQKEIRDTIAARYAFDGITVADGQPAVLHVTYTESAGKRRPVTKDYFQPTGQTVEDTKCAFTFTLTVGTDTVWSYAAKGSEVGFLRGEINETTVRNQAFKNALDAIHAVPFPYYVPADKGQLLPALFTLQKSRIGDD